MSSKIYFKSIIIKQGYWLPFSLLLVLGLLLTPFAFIRAHASTRPDTALNATIYLTTNTLKPIFQDNVNQQLPSITNKILENHPELNNPLTRPFFHPSATVTNLTTQKNGIIVNMTVKLYDKDPNPAKEVILTTYSVKDSSTMLVSGKPVPGHDALVDGPLGTIEVPIGKLTDVNTTVDCGDSALAIHLSIPTQFTTPDTQLVHNATLANPANYTHTDAVNTPLTVTPTPPPTSTGKPATKKQTIDAYVAITEDALTTFGNELERIPISRSLAAQDIHIGIQEQKLTIAANISLLDSGIIVASTKALIEPLAIQNIIGLHVHQIEINTFSMKYNDNNSRQELENKLNSKIAAILGTRLSVSSARIGPDKHITCAGDNILMITGKTTISANTNNTTS